MTVARGEGSRANSHFSLPHLLGRGSFLLSKALHAFFPITAVAREAGNKCYKPGSWSREWVKHQENPCELITAWKAGPGILSLNLFARDGKKRYFHGEGIKWIHADDRYLFCFANNKSSFQRSGICTNPHLSLKQLADLCFSEAERSVKPLYLFVSANKYVGLCTNTLEMSPRLCSIFNLVAVFLVLQLACSMQGDNTGSVLLHALITGTVLAHHLFLGPR